MTVEMMEKLREEQAKPRQEVQIDPASFDAYVGYYKLGPLIFTISRDGNNFFSQLLGQQRVQIYPESAHKFFLKVVHAQISFETDAQGHATGLVLHQNGREQPQYGSRRQRRKP